MSFEDFFREEKPRKRKAKAKAKRISIQTAIKKAAEQIAKKYGNKRKNAKKMKMGSTKAKKVMKLAAGYRNDGYSFKTALKKAWKMV